MDNIDLYELIEIAGDIVKNGHIPEKENSRVFSNMIDLVGNVPICTFFKFNGDCHIITIECKDAKLETDDWFETMDICSINMYLNDCEIGEKQKKYIFNVIATIKIAGALKDIQPLLN